MRQVATGHAGTAWVVRSLIIGALWISGCGSSASSPPTSSSSSSSSAAAPAAATSAPAPTTAAAAPKPAAATAPPAAQSSSQSSATATTPAEDLNALYEAAKAEGELTFYTTLNTNNGQPIVQKFLNKYPGVKINYNRQNSEKLEEVMTQEARAGKLSWDVVECNEDVFVRLIDNKFIQAYSPSAAAAFPANLRDPNGYWVTDRVNAQTPSLNTNLVKPEEYPTAWEDLTRPAWKGRLAVEQGNVLLFSAMKAEWGADRALSFWKGIAANQPSIRSGNTESAQLLAAGEFPLAVNIYTGEPNRLAMQGAPTKVIPLDPVFLQLQLIGMGAKSEHPNAARLFINWFLMDGQTAMNENGVLPGRPDVFAQAAAYLGNARIVPIQPEIAARSAADFDEWRQTMGIQ
jgi:iron(III) transport system substrate-binding protein